MSWQQRRVIFLLTPMSSHNRASKQQLQLADRLPRLRRHSRTMARPQRNLCSQPVRWVGQETRLKKRLSRVPAQQGRMPRVQAPAATMQQQPASQPADCCLHNAALCHTPR